MIIKSLSRKRPTFLQLARYICREGKERVPIVRHNLLTRSNAPDKLAEEIEEISQFTKLRKNNVFLYHEILSFDEKDRPSLNDKILRDISRQYLHLRLGERGAGFAGFHEEKAHTHIHIMASACELGGRRKLRLSKTRFGKIKKEMSAYVKERWPEIRHSYDHTKKRSRSKVKERSQENQRAQRLKEKGSQALSKKEQAREAVLGSLEKTTSNKEFLDSLKKAGYQVYRRGSHAGIIRIESGTRYRLKTLGVHEAVQEKIKNYERFLNQAKELEKVQSKKGLKRDRGKGRG